MADSTEEKLKLTRAEAAAKIKGAPKGTRFYVHIWMDVPVVDNDDQCFSLGGHGSAVLSRDKAVEFVRNLFTDKLEERGARVPLTIRAHKYQTGPGICNYWIG
jgi:hypothetical protein